MGHYKQIEEIVRLMNNPELIRNTSIIAHVDHGKTTLSDSLLAAAGIISAKKAGEELELDGALIVVDAVQGPMAQTETVLRQALKESVKPILFINKVDRLIEQIKLTPEDIQRKFAKIILKINGLIEKYASAEHKGEWKVTVEDGRVAFGSALHKWGIDLTHMKSKGITFKEIIDAYTGQEEEAKNKVEALSEKAPLHETILDMFCEHLPSPLQAQSYRQSQIWPGEVDGSIGKGMAKADPSAPLLMCINEIKVEAKSGVAIAIGRVFSGTVEKGKAVQLITSHKRGVVQQVYLVMVEDKSPIGKIPAGNIAALTGLPDIYVGETVAEDGVKTQPFEALKYVSDPVVVIAVKLEDTNDLPRFNQVMHKLTKEDPSLRFTIDRETGEYLLSGIGELQLEVAIYRIQEAKVKIKTGKPIVAYRETIGHDYKGKAIMGKSPNKHNKLWVTIEKLSEEDIEAIRSGKISEMQSREDRQRVLRQLGWSTDDARNVIAVEGTNILVNRIKGRQYVEEIISHVKSGFSEAVSASVLANEPAYGLRVNLEDMMVHEDPVHRGPAQVQPMTRRPIWCAFLLSDPKLLEPVLALECEVANEFESHVITVVQKRRGKILDRFDEEDMVVIKAEMPVSESFGLAEEMRSSTQGRAYWSTQFSRWAFVPESMQADIIRSIRERKKLSSAPPKAGEFYEET